MFDNGLNTALFASVIAVAIGAAAEIVQAEVDLDRTVSAVLPASAVRLSEPLQLPRVVVTGHRIPEGSAPSASVAGDVTASGGLAS